MPLGRIAGIPIRVHWTFALLILFIVVVYRSAGEAAVGFGLLWIAALFACVVTHEISHCLVARRRGAEVLGILLLPIGGVSQLAAMPEAPNDEFAVAIVGPLTSLGLGVALGVAGLAFGAHVWPPTILSGSWWVRLGWLNLLLAGFNLLPALPMDGGRVLRATLERHRSRLDATLLAGRIARYVAVLMLLAGFFIDIWLMFIAIFVYLGARAEEEAARHHDGTAKPPSDPWHNERSDRGPW
jgi:Zn-dependent protease